MSVAAFAIAEPTLSETVAPATTRGKPPPKRTVTALPSTGVTPEPR